MVADDWQGIGWARRAQYRETNGLAVLVGLDPVSILLSLVPVVAIGTGRALRAAPLLNPIRQQILVGGRRLKFSDIDSARLIVDHRGQSRDLWLWFGASGALLEAPLRVGQKAQMDAAEREILIDILESSSIAIPTDPYDPKGKFARSGFPTHITKDEAIALVRNPPLPGEPLPIIEP